MKTSLIKSAVSSLAAICLSLNPAPIAAQEATAIVSPMTVIAEAYQKLSGQIAKPEQNESSLELIRTILEKSAEAGKHVPPGAAKLDEAGKEAFAVRYQLHLKLMDDILEAIGTALKLEDNVTAEALFKTLQPMARPEHSEKYK